MKFRPIYAIAALLLFLSACNSSGYHRTYIVSDAVEEEVVSEPPEKF